MNYSCILPLIFLNYRYYNYFILSIFQSVGRVSYTRQKTAPSIPFPGRSYGYEEDDYGQLVPKEVPERDQTIGPTYYNVTHVCFFTL